MRSAPKVNMPVVLKYDANSPVMHITEVNEKDNSVKLFWLDKVGTPYTGTVNTDVLEKYNPKKDIE